MIEDEVGLFVTIGAPGSGKSTWAKKNLPPTCLRLERDRFRECLFGTRRAYHNHAFEHDEKSAVVSEAMIAALYAWPVDFWAVTDTGLEFKAVRPFFEAALLRNRPITFVTFERDVTYLKWANRYRPQPHRVPDEELMKRIDLFNSPDAWWRKLIDDPFYTFVDGTACS